MNPLQQFLDQAKAKINSILAGLPPLEQFEKAPELAYGFRMLQQAVNDFNTQAGALGNQCESMYASLKETVTATVKQELLASKELIPKADHDAAVTAAVNQATATIRKEIADEAAVVTLVATRRQALVDGKKLPAIAAAKIPHAALAGDAYEVNAIKISDRLKKAEQFGITASLAPVAIEQIAELPLDAEGDAQFAARMALIESTMAGITASKKPAGAAAPVINPAAGAGAGTGAAAAATETNVADVYGNTGSISRLC